MDSNQGGGIDLHIHSTASDGTHSPTEIVEMAAHAGLRAIAITDHDTIDGSRTAFNGSIPAGLRFITGIEISVSAPVGSPVSDGLHILGYGIDPDNDALNTALDKFQQIRKTRIYRIVERLHELGIPLDLQMVLDETGDGTAGRPHVAEAMVKAGYADNINDAFDRYLGNGQQACVPKSRMACDQAFELIKGAGGIPVLAHPYLLSHQDEEHLTGLLAQLCDMGLEGLEVLYPKHTPEAVVRYTALAEKFGLLITGGTDYHGALIPEIELGYGSGDLHVPYDLYENLLSRCDTGFAR